MRNWGGIGGLVFTVALLASFSVFGDGPPENVKGAREYYEDLNSVTAYSLMMLAVAGLIAFAGALHRVIGSVVSTAALVTAGGMVLLSGASLVGMDEAADELKGFSYDTSLLDLVETTSYFTVTTAHAVMGLAAIAAGIMMLRVRTLPIWLAWFSIFAGAVGLASVAFMPMFLVWLWLVVTGFVLFIRSTDDAPDATTTT